MNIRLLALVVGFCFLLSHCKAPLTTVNVNLEKPNFTLSQPKLVVGITVDQMRFDYITKFWDDYTDNGIKRLVTEGFFCKNNHFSYSPTYTGPGHAAIYTGTTPAVNGIVGNNWYDKYSKSGVYCAQDTSVFGLADTTAAGKMSPKNLQSTTITDELKLFNNLRSKSIGVSIKDRGAILPAGHLADAAYWFKGGLEGKFISSSYYMSDLPDWVKNWNSSNYSDSLLNTGWNTLKDIADYEESILDNNPYEAPYTGKLQPAFPYNFTQLADSNGYYDLIKASPLGNTLVTDFALQCIKNEALGVDQFCDFLTVSYSSTDYVGHQFAPASKEAQDTYLRLDLELEKLLKTLDSEVGEDNYLVFLTADHGAVHNPNYLKSLGVPAGYFKRDKVMALVDTALYRSFNTTDLVENYSNNQIFINDSTLSSHKLKKAEVERVIANAALKYEGVFKTITRTQLLASEFNSGVEAKVQRGFNQKYSGDVVVLPRMAWMSYPTTGTSHGSPYSYDTHVPLLFYGKGISPGYTDSQTEIRDIAPTVAALLGIQMPNGTTGSPILEVLNQK